MIKLEINFKRLILIILVTFIVGTFFSWFTMNNMDTFKELNKPFYIPSMLFPIVWTILYLLMSISFYIVLESNSKFKNKATFVYVIQLVINSLWSLIFFGFEAYFLSFIWIIILAVVVIIMMYKFYKVDKRASYLNIPYILWIFFAGYLNLSIYFLNK